MDNQNGKKEKGGKMARIGKLFHLEVKSINRKRIELRKSEEKISTEKISNLIAYHKSFKQIKKEIINLEEEVLEQKCEEIIKKLEKE